MVGFAHVVMHVMLCNAMSHAGPDTPITLQMRLSDRTGRQTSNHTFNLTRGYEDEKVVEFDAPRGVFRVTMYTPKFNCGAIDYLAFYSEHDRTITETLVDGVPPEPEPMLMDGTAPSSFLYVAPTFVVFGKDTACNKPVGDPLPVKVVVNNSDQNAYYVQLYPTVDLAAQEPVVVAVRLTTATGEYHYVRLKIPFPQPWHGWPFDYQFNVSEDMVDAIAGDPVDTLLCPRIFETSSG